MSVAASLSQSVLDALTDIDMPKRHPARTTQGSIEADGIWLPVYACDACLHFTPQIALPKTRLGLRSSDAPTSSSPRAAQANSIATASTPSIASGPSDLRSRRAWRRSI